MEKCTLLLNKILGKEKWLKLFLTTFKNITEKKKELKVNEWMKAIHFNHQALLFIATQKAEGIDEDDIEKSLHWKEETSSRYILADNVFEFCKIFNEYIDDIVNFINRKE